MLKVAEMAQFFHSLTLHSSPPLPLPLPAAATANVTVSAAAPYPTDPALRAWYAAWVRTHACLGARACAICET